MDRNYELRKNCRETDDKCKTNEPNKFDKLDIFDKE